MSSNDPNEFEKAAAQQEEEGFLQELWGFLKDMKKWWLWPIVAILLLVGLLAFMSSTGMGPFIYTIF